MKDIYNDWHKSGINETKIMFKRIFVFIKFFSIICFLLITSILVFLPTLMIFWLFPSLLVVQGMYLNIFTFRKKKNILKILIIIFLISLLIFFRHIP